MTSNLTITKSNGMQEIFNEDKVYRSLINSGASETVAKEVLKQLKPGLKSGITTGKLYHLARKLLRSIDRPTGMRYFLKNAIYALGPTGYPFEMFVARLFEAQGYSTEVGRIIQGRCVQHEVDVIATNKKLNQQIMMECKFHKNAKQTSDVKIAMYVESRFRDIAAELKKSGSTHKFKGALVTNTRLTSEALKYCQCTGLLALSWNNPKGEGIEKLIKKTGTYPITILPSASKDTLSRLIKNNLVVAKDVLGKDIEQLSHKTKIESKTIRRIIKQAKDICHDLKNSDHSRL